MGNEPTREQKIESMIERAQNNVSELQSKETELERREAQLSKKLQNTPHSKETTIRSLATKIAAARVQRKMIATHHLTWVGMEQQFETLKLQNEMVDSMTETNGLIKDMKEDTNMNSISKLISEFEKNNTALQKDQVKFATLMEDSLDGIGAERDAIINDVLKDHGIQLEKKNASIQLPLVSQPQQQQPQQPVMLVPNASEVELNGILARLDTLVKKQ